MSVAGPALPGIEADRVGHWLAGHVDGLVPPVESGLVSGGRSNLTFRVTDAAGAAYALRRPPTGGVLSTAHDVSREWRFISALASTAVPVPSPVAYCADTAVTGAEFYVMEFVEGLVLADPEAGMALAYQARVRAVFDWELATSGDPMADLGWLASNWQDGGEQLGCGPGTWPGTWLTTATPPGC